MSERLAGSGATVAFSGIIPSKIDLGGKKCRRAPWSPVNLTIGRSRDHLVTSETEEKNRLSLSRLSITKCRPTGRRLSMQQSEKKQQLQQQGIPVARLQFELSREKLEEFEQLRQAGGFETRKDLLNNAITLLKWAMKHAREGHVVAAVDERTQKYFELEMPFLSHVESQSRSRVG